MVPLCGTQISLMRLQFLRYLGEMTDEMDHNITMTIRDLFRSMSHTNQAVPPVVLVTLFRSAFPQFAQRTERGYAQQDAEECWTTLIRCLSAKLPPLAEEGKPSSSSNAIAQLFK